MEKPVLNLLWLYPDLLNLHGERGSVQAFVRAGENLGVQVNVKRIEDFGDKIDFDSADLIMLLPGELKELGFIKPALEKQKSELSNYIENGGYVVAIGTTGMLFGNKTTRENGEVFEGLGILDMEGKERKYIHGDDIHFRINSTKQEIFGSQIQAVDCVAVNPLGTTLFGRGNDGEGSEGAIYKNLIFTNCLGPVFVKNPWWTESIVKDIILKKYLGVKQNKENTLENASFDSCLEFTKKKPEYFEE